MKRVLALSLIGFLAGCGPEKSQLDLERELSNQRFSQKSAEFSEVAGIYEGVGRYGNTEIARIRLYLALTKEKSPTNPENPDATLSAAGKIFFGSSAPAVVFDSVSYFPFTQEMVIAGQYPGSGRFKMNGVYRNRTIGGTITFPMVIETPDGRGTIQLQFELKKVE